MCYRSVVVFLGCKSEIYPLSGFVAYSATNATGQRFECALSTALSPALKRSSLYIHVGKRMFCAIFLFMPKCSSARSTVNVFLIYLKGGLENFQKSTETKEKVFQKLHFT